MQLVLSNNRIIAHGENFLAMGGVVINTETGAKYDNATIADCDCFPSDINEVGYEYHAGVFVPCAPFGKGNNNGYVMEVCETCATPRNSGLPIKDVKWSKISSINCAGTVDVSLLNGFPKDFTFPISKSVLAEYSMIRYKIKAGSYFTITQTDDSIYEPYAILSLGEFPLYKGINSTLNESYTSIMHPLENKTDLILPFCLVSSGYGTYDFYKWSMNYQHNIDETNEGYLEPIGITNFWHTNGVIVDPLTITVNLPNNAAYPSGKYSEANFVIDLEGRR